MKTPKGKKSFSLLLALAWSLCPLSYLHAQAEPFYKGKTIKVIVGTTPGALYDQWSRIIAAHIGRNIPGNPEMLVQNMPGAGHQIAANYLYNVAKPDGLTVIGSIIPTLYLDQLVGRKEVQYDWAKFTWIGSPVKGEHQMLMRADAPYKSIEDIRNAKEPPKCGSLATGGTDYIFSRLLEEVFPPLKIQTVLGYPGGPEIDLAIERGEVQCRSFTVEAFFSREPYHTWRKKGFVRNIIQTGRVRDPRLSEVSTMHELMDRYKTPDPGRRLATVILAGGALGRPMLGPPGIPLERVKTLREAFTKTMKDPGFLDDIKKRNYELEPTTGEELEAIVKEAMAQPAETIQRLKKILGN
jgi:tripartite-type tricarboxylate transporter receptor subunit TctC